MTGPKRKDGMTADNLSTLLSVCDVTTVVWVEVNGTMFLANTCEIAVGGGLHEAAIIHCHPGSINPASTD